MVQSPTKLLILCTEIMLKKATRQKELQVDNEDKTIPKALFK